MNDPTPLEPFAAAGDDDEDGAAVVSAPSSVELPPDDVTEPPSLAAFAAEAAAQERENAARHRVLQAAAESDPADVTSEVGTRPGAEAPVGFPVPLSEPPAPADQARKDAAGAIEVVGDDHPPADTAPPAPVVGIDVTADGRPIPDEPERELAPVYGSADAPIDPVEALAEAFGLRPDLPTDEPAPPAPVDTTGVPEDER